MSEVEMTDWQAKTIVVGAVLAIGGAIAYMGSYHGVVQVLFAAWPLIVTIALSWKVCCWLDARNAAEDAEIAKQQQPESSSSSDSLAIRRAAIVDQATAVIKTAAAQFEPPKTSSAARVD